MNNVDVTRVYVQYNNEHILIESDGTMKNWDEWWFKQRIRWLTYEKHFLTNKHLGLISEKCGWTTDTGGFTAKSGYWVFTGKNSRWPASNNVISFWIWIWTPSGRWTLELCRKSPWKSSKGCKGMCSMKIPYLNVTNTEIWCDLTHQSKWVPMINGHLFSGNKMVMHPSRK